MPDEILLNEAAYAVWQVVKERGPIELGEVVKQTGVDQAQVSAAATEAAQHGYFKIDEREREEIVFAENARQLVATGLPEQLATKALAQSGGKMPMSKFAEWAKSADVAVNEALKWGTARGWISKEKDAGGPYVEISTKGQAALVGELDDLDFEALRLAGSSRSVNLDDIAAAHDRSTSTTVGERLRRLLSNRPEFAKIKTRTERQISITTAGNDAFSRTRKVIERNTLTPKDLESGAWREIKLRPYDVKLAAKDVYPAKIHPLRKIIEQTRRAFLEMGFSEVVSPMVESAFWNFDALFQPQDHPAREMQDTFYMRHPATTPLPGESGERGAGSGEKNSSGSQFPAPSSLLDNVRRTHEDGWETGSEGWGYKWSPDVSRQVVLRTHTTAATIRALAANPNPPGKFFCVGWTYRNETISFKHLPVFHQVDGIIIDEDANLASLMGTLQEFYSKMGFGRVKFKPAFYPYTEPSVDVVVYMESRGKWIEMGGAGIFRPEVTLPLGCKFPVLAWGLGIERLAMIRFGVSDIRELYGTNLGELEKVPLCR